MRIDDSDTFRNVSGATESILDTLHIYGLYWDGPVLYQTDNLQIYQRIVKQLINQDLVYPCSCTRKALSTNKTAVYSGFCLKSKVDKNLPHALRIKSKDLEISFDDEMQGHQIHSLVQQHGDFIVKRKDNIIAYQLAVVIDDSIQNISHVIRGFDLLDSTPKQIFLQQILGYSTPKYCHIPVIVDPQGHKLSKQTFAQAISTKTPEKTLFLLLQLLAQKPPVLLKNASVNELICWAIDNWNSLHLKNKRAINREFY